jgi:hypothetical protein
MAGKLVQVATNTVTSPVANVTLTGIDSDDVYVVFITGYLSSASTAQRFRVTKSGTAQSDAEYDFAGKYLRTDTSFTKGENANQTEGHYSGNLTSSAAENAGNHILYLYNFNSSSEFSLVSLETAGYYDNGGSDFLAGHQGTCVHTVASASDGIQFFQTSGNITAGTFTLYKVL